MEVDNGELSDIEMQAWKESYEYGMRAEIQAARLLNNNAKKGRDWFSPMVYQISSLNFHYRKDDNKEMAWYTGDCFLAMLMMTNMLTISASLSGVKKGLWLQKT